MLSPLRRLWILVPCLLALASLTPMSNAQNVWTWHNDNNRTGWQQNETALKPSTVSQSTFGLLWQWKVKGSVFHQPLAVANVPTGFSNCTPSCNLVFISTEQDMLYAFNAAPSAQSNPLVWSRDLAADSGSGNTAVDCNNLNGIDFGACDAGVLGSPIGVTGTPVIDTTASPHPILYVVGAVHTSSGIVYDLFAYDITSGAKLPNTPTPINGSVTGRAPATHCTTASPVQGNTVTFDATTHIQRSALLLLNGVVYVAFAPFPEKNNGWIFGYQLGANGFAQTAVFNSTPYGTGGGIWQAAAGPAAETRNGSSYIYAVTGNGTFDLQGAIPPAVDAGDTLLKLNPSNFAILDYYTPYDVFTYPPPNGTGRCLNDEDFASGGVLLFPENFYHDQNTSTYPYLLVNADKESTLWVANRDNLGKFNPSGGNNIESLYTPTQADSQQGYWGSPAYWKYTDQNNNNHYQLYYSVTDQQNTSAAPYALNEYQLLTSGTTGPLPKPTQYLSTTKLFCFQSPTPSVSSNSTVAGTGIVWAIESRNTNNVLPSPTCDGSPLPASLHAFNATSVNQQELYSSRTVTTPIGYARGFPTPTIFLGQVYMGTNTGPQNNLPAVDVFGFCNTVSTGCKQ